MATRARASTSTRAPYSPAWRVGRLNRPPPTCYHYDVVAAIEAVADVGALVPDRPLRMPKTMRRKYTGGLLALYRGIEEPAPLVWFSWSPTWNPRSPTLPHPGTFVPRPAARRLDEGIIRLSAPAYVAKLRWSDYLTLNNTTRLMRNAVAELGHPPDWLATDQCVPASAFISIDAWIDDAWRDVEQVLPVRSDASCHG